MTIHNRRLEEVRKEIKAYRTLIDCSDANISERLIYQGKIESLEKEEKDILERYEVII